MKEEGRQDGPFELGVWTLGQGNRIDVQSFRDAIMKGMKRLHLWESFPREMAKFPRMYNDVKTCLRPMREVDLVVRVLYGRTGLGKTRLIYDCWEEDDEFWRWSVPNTACWFDGYDQHKLVLLDDFAGKRSKMSLVMLLQVLDRYPIMLPVKGSFVWWCPEQIAITTNIHPKDWYNYDKRKEQYHALRRRVHQVLEFKIKKEEGGYEPTVADESFWYDPILYPPPPTISLLTDETLSPEEDRFSFEDELDVPFDSVPYVM